MKPPLYREARGFCGSGTRTGHGRGSGVGSAVLGTPAGGWDRLGASCLRSGAWAGLTRRLGSAGHHLCPVPEAGFLEWLSQGSIRRAGSAGGRAAAVRLLRPSLDSSSPVVKAVRACLLSPPHPPVEQVPQNLQGGVPVHPPTFALTAWHASVPPSRSHKTLNTKIQTEIYVFRLPWFGLFRGLVFQTWDVFILFSLRCMW